MTHSLNKLLCDPSSPQPTAKRVNEHKQYVQWEGCTIIMKLHPQSHCLANMIYLRLKENQIVGEYVTLLPPESYHVTLRGIRERYRCQNAEEYNQYIVSKYKKMCQLNNQFIESKIDIIEFDFDLGSFDKSPYCGLSLHFKDAGTDEKTLREFESLVINELNLRTEEQSWHITLGYFYKNDGKFSKKEKAMLKAAVKDALFSAMKDYVNPCTNTCRFYCSKPVVCSFKDMTHFEPIVSHNIINQTNE